MTSEKLDQSASSELNNRDTKSPEVNDTSSSSLKEKAGDAANTWLERNRNLVLRQTPVWAQSMVAILIGLGGIAVIGGIFFRIDEVVSVKGQLKSIGGTVEVKTPAGGRVAEVLYEDGEKVKKGQLLVRFDTRQATDEKDTLTRLIKIEREELDNRLAALASQSQMLIGRRSVMEKKLETKTLVTTELEKLAAEGGFQKLQLLEQKDQVYELQKQLSEIDEQLSQNTLQAGKSRLDAQKSINQMQSQLKKAELQLQYQNVLAPVNGIVFDPQAAPEGVLSIGERILSLVPQGSLYAEVFIPNQDIGFVEMGQKTKVRVDAFPFSRYGELNGAVSQISADALPPDSAENFYRFPAKLSLNQSYLESKGVKIPLQAGMSVTANLKLRDKRVISLISDLLVDQTDSVRSIRQQ